MRGVLCIRFAPSASFGCAHQACSFHTIEFIQFIFHCVRPRSSLSADRCVLVWSVDRWHSASFPNVSKDLRITLNFGFHKREAVLGARDGFDEERIYQRSRMIPLAMDARAQRFPDEKPYALPREHPCAGRPERYTGLEASREVTQGPNLGI